MAGLRSALLWYIVGGLTFLPLCLVSVVAAFLLLAPRQDDGSPVQPSAKVEVEQDLDLTPQRKQQALDLAVSNAARQEQAEKDGTDKPFNAAAAAPVPPSARRIGPPAPAPTPKAHRSAWLTVTRSFEEGTSTGMTAPTATPSTLQPDAVRSASSPKEAAVKSTSYVSGLYKGLLDYRSSKAAEREKKAAISGASGKSAGQDGASTTPSRSRSAQLSSNQAKSSFFCILKGPILYLYSSDDVSSPTTECHAAIDLRGKRVSLYIAGVGDIEGEPGEQSDDCEDDDDDDEYEAVDSQRRRSVVAAVSLAGTYDTASSANVSEAEGVAEAAVNAATDTKAQARAKANWRKARRAAVRDGELFIKRNAIRVVAMGAAGGRKSEGKHRLAQWYIWSRSAFSLEDWYHAILHASMIPSTSAASAFGSATYEQPDPIGALFSTDDMTSLLSSLDMIPDPIPLRWLNALVGRIFFSIYRTAALEDYIRRKMMKKLTRVKTPGFLSDIKIREIDLGRSPPAFSRPMLKTLTGEGEASMEVTVHYTGCMRLTISTSLTISLGSRFKPYSVPIVLAVVLRQLEGNLLLHIKPPPSASIWYGFTQLPRMDIAVEPVVSERKVQWSMVTGLIESRIKELMVESLVVPHMDAIPFFDSRPYAHRGGIWADAAKRPSAGDREGAQESSDRPSRAPTAPSSSSVSSTPALSTSAPSTYAETVASTSGYASSIRGEKDSTRRRRGDRGGTSAFPATPIVQPSSSIPVPVLAQAEDTVAATAPALINSALSTSPAAAGLSSLLARDLAANSSAPLSASAGAVQSSIPPSAGQTVPDSRLSTSGESLSSISGDPNNRRRSWFAPSRFGSTGTTAGASVASSMAGSADAKVESSRQRNGLQSSLAWGNASLSLAGQRGSPVSLALEDDDELPVIDLRTPQSSARSQSIVNGDPRHVESLSFAVADKQILDNTAMPHPSVRVRGPTEDEGQNTEDAGSSSAGPTGLRRASTVSDVSVASAKTTSSSRSHGADLVASPSVLSLRGPSDEHTGGGVDNSTLSSTNSQLSVADSDSLSSATTTDAPLAEDGKHSAAHEAPIQRLQRVAPPAQPFPTGDFARSQPVRDGALPGPYRSRYGAGAGNDREFAGDEQESWSRRDTWNSGSSRGGNSSAQALAIWNKAKATMSDKDSRQAAAATARDALKKSWASWKDKRNAVTPSAAERNSDPQDSTAYVSHGFEIRAPAAERSRTRSWLLGDEGSTTDPASMALGFDVDSLDGRRLPRVADDQGEPSASTSRLSSARQSPVPWRAHTDDDAHSSSSASGASERTPYRDMRASKEKGNGSTRGLSPSPARLASASTTQNRAESGLETSFTAQRKYHDAATMVSAETPTQSSPQSQPAPDNKSSTTASRTSSPSSPPTSSSRRGHGAGVKVQPGRANMMAIPGILNKDAPQSFAYTKGTKEDADISATPLMVRQASQGSVGSTMFRLPFGGATTAAAVSEPVVEASESAVQTSAVPSDSEGIKPEVSLKEQVSPARDAARTPASIPAYQPGDQPTVDFSNTARTVSADASQDQLMWSLSDSAESAAAVSSQHVPHVELSANSREGHANADNIRHTADYRARSDALLSKSDHPEQAAQDTTSELLGDSTVDDTTSRRSDDDVAGADEVDVDEAWGLDALGNSGQRDDPLGVFSNTISQ